MLCMRISESLKKFLFIYVFFKLLHYFISFIYFTLRTARGSVRAA